MRLCIYKCYLACTVILVSVSGIFRHIRVLFKSILTHIQNFVCLAYSEPCHILITKHIQTQRYIHNTILNIFTKAPSWTFDTVLNAPLLKMLCFTVSLTLYFRLILARSRFIQPYLLLLRHIKNPTLGDLIVVRGDNCNFSKFSPPVFIY